MVLYYLLSKSDNTEVRPMLHTGRESGPWYSSTLCSGLDPKLCDRSTLRMTILYWWRCCWWRCHRKYLTNLLAMSVVLSA